ncbi:MAG TPA: FAD-binding oxidoreductase, partial [Myxococcota bacterium]
DAVEERARSVVATTTTGVTVRAAWVVYATGYELARSIAAPNHSIHSTWAMATPPQRAKLWPTQCMIWEASERYLYLRTTSDGRIIIGGEDEPFADEAHRDALTDSKIKTLQKKLQLMFPDVDTTADYHWAGSFGGSDTGTPSIGRVPGKGRTLALLGFGGNGITFSMLGAQILRGIVSGEADPDEDLFALKP